MRLSLSAISLWFVAASCTESPFLRDVVRANGALDDTRIHQALLEKAVPLDEYRADLRSRGLDFGADSRVLQYSGMDDYYMDESFMNDFSGYSLKYAACQPVQKFSEDAILAGEYTPLVTDDIVILRLCPSSSCNPKRAFGCSSKYVDYAIGISDYIRIMLRSKMDKQQKLCNWCSSCLDQRRMEDAVVEDGDEEQQQQTDDVTQDDQQDQEMDDQNQEEQEQDNEEAVAGDDTATGDDTVAGGDDASNNVNYSSSCPYFESLCYSNGVSVCNADGVDAGDDGSTGYLATEGYLNYLNCQHVNGYYLRPRCNGYDQSITMGVFYDKFCSQYAGDKVNMNSLLGNLGMESSVFRDFYAGNSCIDCSESSSGPYYDANSNMCNRLHATAASCSTNLPSNEFNYTYDEDEGQCTYIEMLHKGAYDEEGRIYTARSIIRQVTDGQKFGLVVSLLLCAVLAVYSCYLHHLIANLLVRSITHTELLPHSRASRRSSKGSGRRAAPSVDDEDEEWHEVSKVSRKKSGRYSRDRSYR